LAFGGFFSQSYFSLCTILDDDVFIAKHFVTITASSDFPHNYPLVFDAMRVTPSDINLSVNTIASG
jgi:hypothetical protein